MDADRSSTSRSTSTITKGTLPRNIRLAQQIEAFTEENVGSTLGIVDVECQSGETARMREQRISEMHVLFRHQERGQKFCKLGRHFAQLDHHHRADAVGDVVLAEQDRKSVV